MNFIKRSSEFADTIAFILPLSFAKPSMKNKIPEYFHLQYEEVLPDDSYLLDGESYSVKCVFQIWKKSDNTIVKGNIHAYITLESFTQLLNDHIVIGSADINENDLESIDGITAGTVAASKAVVVDANKDATGFRNITLTGELDAGSLDVSGNVDVDGTLETDALSINGTAVTSTATELNILDGVTSTTAELNILDGVTSTAAELNILDGKAFLDEDNFASNSATGIASQQSIKAYVDGITATNITSTGALNSGSITSGFGNINTGSSTITTTGLISGGSLDIDNVLINGTTIGHTDDTDLITLADGVVTVAGEVSMTTLDIGGTNVTSTASELNALDGITAVVGELNALDLGSTAIGTAIASKAVVIDANKDYTGIRNFSITGNLSVGGTTTVVDTVTMNEAKEFSQEHLGETIVSHRVVTQQEALDQCEIDNTYCKVWNDEKRMEVFFTHEKDLK